MKPMRVTNAIVKSLEKMPGAAVDIPNGTFQCTGRGSAKYVATESSGLILATVVKHFLFKSIIWPNPKRVRRYLQRGITGLAIFFGLSHASATTQNINIEDLMSYEQFATWQGIEPDKWATIWLIRRMLVPEAVFILSSPDSSQPKNAYPFGLKDASLRRATQQSMFRRLLQTAKLDTPELSYIDRIIHDVEVNIWDEAMHPHSDWFETMFRKLQARYHRDLVPIDCYLAFFDRVHALSSLTQVTAQEYSNRLELNELCPGAHKPDGAFIEQLTHLDILRQMSIGKSVTFVDTREDEEYQELHLPGAKLLRLRDVDKHSVERFSEADLVVAYCVKDFRGFEVAKSMKRHGLDQVATLSPNGLKGWIAAGLPLAGKNGMDDVESTNQLMQCAMEPKLCLHSGGSQ